MRAIRYNQAFIDHQSHEIMIKGSIVAIVTPMHEDGSLDYPGLRKLIDWHIAEGTDGIVIVGTTGESATVNVQEHCELIKLAVEHTKGRIPIIAGTGGNSTEEAIKLTQFAKEAGADAALVVVPYYNRPTQEGMYRHFKAIAEAVDLPIILYNVPGRTVADMSNDTVLRLAAIPNIVGLKDATGNIGRGAELLRLAPKSFAVYSGDDPTAMALMFMGGAGNISVTANVAPRAMHELCVAAMAGDDRQGGRDQQPGHPAARQAVRRAESGAGQMGAGRNGPDAGRPAPAAGAACRRIPRHRPRRLARSRCPSTALSPQGSGIISDTSCLQRLPSYDMTIRKTITPAATRGFVLSALMVSLSGCGMMGSVMESDKLDYRAAKKAAPLDVPPDLTQLQKDNRYAVPDGRGVATASGYAAGQGRRPGASPAATPIGVAGNAAVKVERNGNQRWLVVKQTPGTTVAAAEAILA